MPAKPQCNRTSPVSSHEKPENREHANDNILIIKYGPAKIIKNFFSNIFKSIDKIIELYRVLIQNCLKYIHLFDSYS